MKSVLGNVLVLGLVIIAVSGDTSTLDCEVSPVKIDTEWADMKEKCTELVRKQVQMELTASMTYLSMASHFAHDSVNRPGFAERFFSSAGEEREHAIKLISYLLMRGELVANLAQLINNPASKADNWTTAMHALESSLRLEVEVTNSIRHIIEVCESVPEFNDYHLVDYLTVDFLDEQYKGQREIAGHIENLGKMMKGHEMPLAEFLYDKKLLNGEPL